MKEKIIAELKTAYAKLGLSDEAFDGVASLLEKTITEESEIATAVRGDNVSALLKAIQGNVDSWRNKYHDSDKAFKAYKDAHPEGKQEPVKDKQDDGGDEPEWAKKLRESNEAIAARLDRADKEKKDAETLASVRAALEKAGCTNKGMLNLTLKGFALGDKESEEDAVKRLTADYNTNVKETFGEGVVPPTGAGHQTPPDPQKDADKMNEYLRSMGYIPQPEKSE